VLARRANQPAADAASSPHERSERRNDTNQNPDVALMSFVK
jgi:hypothetical protein